MRLWSVHPKYLDAKGLIALWRESLLAKHVLEGKTKGYRNHPQLIRFKSCKRPVECINQYLQVIYDHSVERGYNFDDKKINSNFTPVKLNVTKGQIEFEAKHLAGKLMKRSPAKYTEFIKEKNITAHPLFTVIPGPVEKWEIISDPSD